MTQNTIRNQHYPLADELADLFQTMDAARAAERWQWEGERDSAWTEVKHECRRLDQQARGLSAEDAAALRERIEKATAESARQAMTREWGSTQDLLGSMPVNYSGAAQGDFWWIRTDWWWLPDNSIAIEHQSDGLHFYGQRKYDSDPLWSGNVGMVARFGLDPARRPHSPSGRYASLPWFDLRGKVRGWAGYKHCPWTCDDKWSKCWMHVRQTVLQYVQGRPVIVGQNDRHDQLIFLEGEGELREYSFWGLTVPPVNFGLADWNADIIVEVEVRFDMQMEGASWLSFSPQPNPMQSVVLQTLQWPITVA